MKTAKSRLSQLRKAAAAAPPPTTPIAAARLEKLHKEIALLEHKVRVADLERRALERELLFAEEARDLLNAAITPIADGLRTWPKGLSPRLHGQPIKSIEDTLAGAVNALLANATRSIADFKEKTTRQL